jgi:hypothetical protein
VPPPLPQQSQRNGHCKENHQITTRTTSSCLFHWQPSQKSDNLAVTGTLPSDTLRRAVFKASKVHSREVACQFPFPALHFSSHSIS